MNRLHLFKPHQIYLPTFLGLFVITVFLFGVGAFTLSNLATFLAYQNPVGGKYLVVEGWLGKEALQEAVNRFEKAHYQFIITTGGPQLGKNCDELESYAESAATYIYKQGVEQAKVIALPTPESAQDRTFLSAVIVREWLLGHDSSVVSLDVFSGSVHARRTHDLYEMAFRRQKVDIGIIAAKPYEYSLHAWWSNSAGAKTVITETIGWLWVNCCFFPGEYRSHQEKWGIN